MEEASVVATAIAALSATAAAVSARSSRQAVTQANAPFVWPSIAIRGRPRQYVLAVRLHNDGPGVAFDVRFAAASALHDFREYAIAPVRAMRSGEQVPPLREPEPQVQPRVQDDAFEYPLPDPHQTWYVFVRYSDGLARNWEVRVPLEPEARIGRPRQLRRSRLDVWRGHVDW
jgi:hypothetical protein